MTRRVRVALAAFLIGLATPVLSQPSLPVAVPGSELTIYLMTMGPGDQVWEKFGHNAIWIHDDLRHTDIAYNWGLFDFNAVDFYPRFLKGEMLYSMELQKYRVQKQ